MRIVKDKPTSREASFKANKNEDYEPDEIEETFVRRLKKGSGRYLECYNYHNFIHKVANCHMNNFKVDPRIKPLSRNASKWKTKDNEKCGLVLLAQKQKGPWYIDSGCLKRMTGDKDKFIFISKRKSGNVTFGNDEPDKIKGKGMVSLSNGKGKSHNVFLVDGLKHN
jgi:hypothetical protein